MIRILFLLVFFITFSVSAQQWSGDNNLTSAIYRNGSIGVNGLYLSRFGGSLVGDSNPYTISSSDNEMHDLVLYGNSASTLHFRLYDGDLKLGYNTTPNTILFNSGAAFFSGNVGIGVSSPATKLEIAGHLKAYAQFHLGENYSSEGRGIIVDNGASTSWELFTLRNNSGTHIRVLGNGNVGIGTTSPQYKLHVSGSGHFQNRLTVQGEIPNDNNAAFWNNSDTGYGFYSQGGAGGRYAFHFLNKEGASIVYGRGDGNVGIGTTTPDAKLAVKGTVHAQEVKVDLLVPGPDYVFEPTYNLPTLAETEAYIKANKHLPEVPSAKEMEANGINLSEMNMLLLKKVEELTLYVIELKKREQTHQMEIEELKKEVKKTKSK